ncbi:MAG TPA: vWA domain-containing protein, partial [Prolixibacteraceae bacterium]|nr:vWA domain-containing protein [Prolixibacteraceae bacterium]
KHVIDSMASALRNVNVMFVIDATSSMIPYSKTIQDAIKSSMRSLLKGQNNYRFGALLYRDASEGNANAIHYTRDLSSNYNGIISLLSRYMTPTYNKCNNDPEECVFYGMKKAIERFDPSPDESNFIILIGDAGNHNRTKYKDCSGAEVEDFTNVPKQELEELMIRKNVNLFAIQVNHQVTTDAKPAFDAFRSQVEEIMQDVAIARTPDGNSISKESVISRKAKDIIEINAELGIPGFMKMAPDGGSINPALLGKEIENEFQIVDSKINDHLESISKYLNGKLDGANAKQLKSFINKLESKNISPEKLNIVFQKNGQQYNTGYAERYEPGLKNPSFQSVLLMSQDDLFLIKKSLERLIPTDDMSQSQNDSRSFIIYGWQEILVDILGYFPEVNEAIDTLSLYTLSAILTGWGGKEKYKDIRLLDVSSPDRFPDEMLYEYLIDWCITKGHIQSIYDGQNLLTGDFFDDHMWTIFYEYLYILTNGSVQQDDTMKQKFIDYFKSYNKEYNNYKASFRIPMGTGTGMKHYWIDSRIFPHSTKVLGEPDLIETLYKAYLH